MKLYFDTAEPIPLHVVGKCPNDSWPVKKLTDVWKIFGKTIAEISRIKKLRTHAFVMMRNHYHWLVTLRQHHDKSTEIFTDMHHRIAYEIGGGLSVFEGPPKIIEIGHIEAYRQTYAYIYRNPVDAGLVERAEHYPFSTLPYILGRNSEKLAFPCIDNMNLIYHPDQILNFIVTGSKLNRENAATPTPLPLR